MTIALLVMTDGRRDCIERTIPSAISALVGPISELWIHDDSGDPDFRRWLLDRFPDFRIFGPPDGRSGFGGAIRSAWKTLRADSDATHIFHLEDDFVFRRSIPLEDFVEILDDHPYLVNLALRRQPWNDHERLAGGIVEQHPDAYVEQLDDKGRSWLEHRLFFTTNPGLYRRELTSEEWPEGKDSEGRFSHRLLGDDEIRFGYFGDRASGEAVEHIGANRIGTGY